MPVSPEWLDDCFLHRVKNKVRNDATVMIDKRLFDVPMEFIRSTVEIRFPTSDMEAPHAPFYCFLRHAHEPFWQEPLLKRYLRNPWLFPDAGQALSTITTSEFYRQLCVALGLEVSYKKSIMFQRIQDYFFSMSTNKNVHCMVCLDEAQYLSADILWDLKMLCNFRMDSKNCFFLILFHFRKFHKNPSWFYPSKKPQHYTVAKKWQQSSRGDFLSPLSWVSKRDFTSNFSQNRTWRSPFIRLQSFNNTNTSYPNGQTVSAPASWRSRAIPLLFFYVHGNSYIYTLPIWLSFVQCW